MHKHYHVQGIICALMIAAIPCGSAHAAKKIHALAKVGDVKREFHVDAVNPNLCRGFLSRTKGSAAGEAYGYSKALPSSAGSAGIEYCSWVWSKGKSKTLKAKADGGYCSLFCGSSGAGDGSHPCTNPHNAPWGRLSPRASTTRTILPPAPDSSSSGGITGTMSVGPNLQVAVDTGSYLRIDTAGMLSGQSTSATLVFSITNVSTDAVIASGTVRLSATESPAAVATPALTRTGVFASAPLVIQSLGQGVYEVALDVADFQVVGVTPDIVGDLEFSLEADRPDPESTATATSVPAASTWSLVALLCGIAAAYWILARRRAAAPLA